MRLTDAPGFITTNRKDLEALLPHLEPLDFIKFFNEQGEEVVQFVTALKDGSPQFSEPLPVEVAELVLSRMQEEMSREIDDFFGFTPRKPSDKAPVGFLNFPVSETE